MNSPLMLNSHQAAARTQPCRAPWAWTLATGQAGTLAAADGVRWLRVDSGQVWLTRADERQQPEDVWLSAGDSLPLPAGSAWVLEGWPQACVSVLERPQAAPAARFSGGAARRWFSLAASRLSFAPAC